MKVSSARFRDAVNKAIKGAGCNNLIPLTQLIGIKLSNNELKFLTTDATNNLCVVIDKVVGDDFVATIDATVFGKLVSKITSEDVELTLENEILVIKANGTYKIPLVMDEEGIVEFPDIDVSNLDDYKETSIKLSHILSAYNINRYALAKTLEQPYLTGYYCGDKVVTTDASVITFNNFKLFDCDDSFLIQHSLMQLLTLNTKEDIKCYYNEGSLLFITDDVIIQGYELEGIENYPYNEVEQYLEEAFTSSCKLPKELLLSVLDRLSLFIEPYDKNGAYFSFGRTGLTIHSKKDSSVEVINYIESKDFKSFTCYVDIPMFREQVLANPEDTIKLWYGNDNAIKLESGKVIQVIALLEEYFE